MVLSQLYLALPFLHRVSESGFNRPESKEELRRWGALVEAVGLDLDEEDLKAGLLLWSHWTTDTLRAPLVHTRSLRKNLGFGQSWALFASPETHPNRLQVEAKVNGEWQLVFRRLDSEHQMMASQISFRRVRGVHDGVGSRPGKIYRIFCRFIARGVFARLPAADEVRVAMYRSHTTPPHQPVDDHIRLRHTVNLTRTDVGL